MSRCLLPSPPLARWQAQLVQTQTDLLYLGSMRSGSLSLQSKDPAAATGADGPLSYAVTCAAPLVMSGPKRWPPSNACSLTSGASLAWPTAASIFLSKILWSFCFLIPTSLQPDLRDLGWQELWAWR